MNTRLEVKGFSVLYNCLDLCGPLRIKLIIVSVFVFFFNSHLVNKNNTQLFAFFSISTQEARTLERSSNCLTCSVIRYKVRSSQ